MPLQDCVTDSCQTQQSGATPGEQLGSRSMDTFLQTVQHRALRMAQLATGNPDDAMEVVQEAMTKLVQLYSDKQWDDWRPLFFRILSSRINDFHRRRAVQNRFRGWIDKLSPATSDEDSPADPYSCVAGREQETPLAVLESTRRLDQLEKILRSLPRRQQQAFMLRCWEGMSTADTAAAMGCSQGSVKTHYFRALQTLRQQLEGYRS